MSEPSSPSKPVRRQPFKPSAVALAGMVMAQNVAVRRANDAAAGRVARPEPAPISGKLSMFESELLAAWELD